MLPMPMQVLTVMQTIGIFCAYSIMTLILPALLFYRKIKGWTLTIRFLAYLSVGNFFMISAVLFLQLLHISNRVTLTVFTVLIFFVLYVLFYRVAQGERVKQTGGGVRKYFAVVWERFCNNKLDCLLALVSIVTVFVVYGRNAFMQYGYSSSDIAVHNDWIHAMDQGGLFVDGVYPFGFHCVVYYLHQVFWIDTVVLLRLFWVVQIILFHVLLLAFIRMCCKSRYIAYAGLGIYLFAGTLVDKMDFHYMSPLSQEFGIIFILPFIAFLILFLEQKNRELYARKHEKQEKQDTQKPQLQEEEERIYLLDEVLAESAAREASGQVFAPQPEEVQPETVLTIERNEKDGSLFIKKVFLETGEELKTFDAIDAAQKQKDTMKPGLRKRACNTLKREFSYESSQYLVLFVLNLSMALTFSSYDVMIAGIFCLGVAFGFFFRLFRPWYFVRIICAGIFAIAISLLLGLVAHNGKIPLQSSLHRSMAVMDRTQEDMKIFVPDEEGERTDIQGFVFLSAPTVVSVSIALLFILAVLYFILKQTDYAAKMMSMAAYMALMTLLFIVPGLGLPELMDEEGRIYVYYVYSMIFVWILCADGILNLHKP